MHWLIYSEARNGRLDGLRIVESDLRPHAPTINNGFRSPQEALALLSEYLVVHTDGFVSLDEAHADRHLAWTDRVLHAYRVEPRIVWLVGLSLLISLATLLLLVGHLIT